ncbi:MAG TPA: hypothetical protein VFL53_14655 [Pseudolabrys sp.]|nr:hypothetical protein [Pseudolabrys sp.]
MGILRVLIFAALLAGCAAHVPVLNTQDNVPTTTSPVFEAQERDDIQTMNQSDRTSATRERPEAKKIRPSGPTPVTTASTTPRKDTINTTAINVGSPQKWEKERAEDERKEQRLKQVIEGICRGC